MNTNTTLPTAILSFAFTGVFGPHKPNPSYEPPRVVSASRKVPYARA